MTYTKGPWRACQADGDGCSCHMIWSTGSDCVVAVAIEAKDKSYTGGEGIVDESIVRANAQLIAKSPDLYEAVRHTVIVLCRRLDDMDNLTQQEELLLIEAREALAKVEEK